MENTEEVRATHNLDSPEIRSLKKAQPLKSLADK